jgi:predicted transcriptional regulator YdeE
MNLTEEPETITWPETHYVFVEKTGPFQTYAPAAWGEAHKLLPALLEHNKVTQYISLYEVGPQLYRAGFAIDAPPVDLPAGLAYELFPGGKYSRFILTGPYTDLGAATSRVFEIVAEKGIEVREGFNIENYTSDPRVTPAEELKTEILVATK